jgi:DNA replication initiation complex subunit (GINS family)
MMRQLILVHGRAQEKKDPAKLKQQWLTAWEKGLAKSGLTNPLSNADVHFPYYGDTLDQIVGGMAPDQAAEVIIQGPAPKSQEQQVMREMITEIATHEGISEEDIRAQLDQATIQQGPLNWGWVQGILSALDKVDPVSARIVALVTADVAKYLTDPALKQTINEGVVKAFARDQEAVVVSHSLGTIVAYNVLMSRPMAFPQLKVPLFVTLGSPLAVNAIKSRLRPHTFPPPVGKWYNAMDPDDVVSLYPLSTKHFPTGGTIENNQKVDNWTDNQHSIDGYLDDEKVAKRIYDALI